MATEWNFLSGRLLGDGSVEITETELPINITSITSTISTPSTMQGTISYEVKRLKTLANRPLFEPWNTVILAEASGILKGYGIYRPPTFRGPAWELDIIGLPGYAIGMPYDGDTSFIQEDPLNIYRHVWTHLQSWPMGNLGLTIDATTSPVRVGTPEVDEEAVGSFEKGPRRLNWWSTSDLGSEIDNLTRSTPFDWRENVFWDADQPHCHIELGYPTLGGRDDRLRFVLGENMSTEPAVSESEFTNSFLVLGNGEGRDRITGRSGVVDGRIRRIRSVQDEALMTVSDANRRASEELAGARGQLIVDSIDIIDHPNAPLANVTPGNEYAIFAETDHVTVDDFVRVVSKSESPDNPGRATLTIVRGGVA